MAKKEQKEQKAHVSTLGKDGHLDDYKGKMLKYSVLVPKPKTLVHILVNGTEYRHDECKKLVLKSTGDEIFRPYYCPRCGRDVGEHEVYRDEELYDDEFDQLMQDTYDRLGLDKRP